MGWNVKGWFNEAFGANARSRAVNQANQQAEKQDTSAVDQLTQAQASRSAMLDQAAANRQAFAPTQVSAQQMTAPANITAHGVSFQDVAAPDLNLRAQNQMRGQQTALGQALMQRALGQGGPSAAQTQLQQGLDQQIAASRAMAASQAGLNPALAARNAQRAQTQAMLGTNQQAAQMRAQEQMAAQESAGNLYNNARAQDIGLASTQGQMGLQAALANQGAGLQASQANQAANINVNQFNAQMQQQVAGQNQEAALRAALANQGAGLQAQQMNDAYNNYILGNQLQNQGALADYYTGRANQAYGAQLGTNQWAGQDATQFGRQITGGVMQAGASLGAAALMAPVASDERLKKDIKDAGKDVDGFLRALKAQSYAYKDKKFGDKERYFSPMAQDLEKTDIGRSMVIDTPDGKMVHYGRGLGAILAAQARLNERLDSLEGRAA